ncbi:hypothetical protein L3X38_006822 [Prunus dulcis]|uniref:Uncharacterized protein n=1 Tax=Prunus dulcis TaxID=3755 RepID=A0AAD5F5J1_PRUDU|nr:hypothetical protein L3X38_006822 [Prunus dulcis]
MLPKKGDKVSTWCMGLSGVQGCWFLFTLLDAECVFTSFCAAMYLFDMNLLLLVCLHGAEYQDFEELLQLPY